MNFQQNNKYRTQTVKLHKSFTFVAVLRGKAGRRSTASAGVSSQEFSPPLALATSGAGSTGLGAGGKHQRFSICVYYVFVCIYLYYLWLHIIYIHYIIIINYSYHYYYYYMLQPGTPIDIAMMDCLPYVVQTHHQRAIGARAEYNDKVLWEISTSGAISRRISGRDGSTWKFDRFSAQTNMFE